MPIILTDERVRIPAREKLRHQTPYDVKFISLTLVAIIVFCTSMIYPALQDFQSFHELFYNIDPTSRYRIIVPNSDDISISINNNNNDNNNSNNIDIKTNPVYNPNDYFNQMVKIINSANTTCIHAENYFSSSFNNSTLYDQSSDVYVPVTLPTQTKITSTTKDNAQDNNDRDIPSEDTIDSSSKIVLPSTFHYSCTPSPMSTSSSTVSTTAPSPFTLPQLTTILDDITTNIAVLYHSHVINAKAQLWEKTNRHKQKMGQNKKIETNPAGEMINKMILPQYPPPQRQCNIPKLELNVMCHHRLFCGYFNTFLTWFALRTYIYIQYITDVAYNCVRLASTVAPNISETLSANDKITSTTETIITTLFSQHDHLEKNLNILFWDIFASNPVLYPIKLIISTIRVSMTILYHFFVHKDVFYQAINETNLKHSLVDYIIALRNHVYITKSYRTDIIFDSLSTLHYIISTQMKNTQH